MKKIEKLTISAEIFFVRCGIFGVVLRSLTFVLMMKLLGLQQKLRTSQKTISCSFLGQFGGKSLKCKINFIAVDGDFFSA